LHYRQNSVVDVQNDDYRLAPALAKNHSGDRNIFHPRRVKMKVKIVASVLGFVGSLLFTPLATAADADAAQALAKKEGCLKCHAVDKKKEAKSLKEIASKYKGKADAEEKILYQITAGEKVKLEDGTEEEHKIIKTKDKAELSNLIGWILSLGKK
jgi:cytochrome c